ncbi:MAG: transglutaminase family protein [Burkholderiaceae bacterium]
MVRLDCLIHLQYEAHTPSTVVFNVEPAISRYQTIVREQVDIRGETGMCDGLINHEGTRLLRVPAMGPVEIASRFVVDIQHATHDPGALSEMPVHALPMSALPYLYPSRYCEADKLVPVALRAFGQQRPGYSRIAAVARWVREQIAFDPDTHCPAASHPPASAVDALARRRGGSRELAHLMIALCRALNVPARFVNGIDASGRGIDAGERTGAEDFHAQVEVFLSGRWYLFDPTGSAPTTGHVRLGTGRDASDTAFATVFGSASCVRQHVRARALEDPASDIRLPRQTDMPVSTSRAQTASRADASPATAA